MGQLLILLLLLSSCISDSSLPCPEEPTPDNARYIQLTLRLDDATRSDDPDREAHFYEVRTDDTTDTSETCFSLTEGKCPSQSPTRATDPYEDGDGREDAKPDENQIHDLNIFFYIGSDGLNSEASTSIVKKAYKDLTKIDLEDKDKTHQFTHEADVVATHYIDNAYKVTIQVDPSEIEKQNLHVAVIANAGDELNYKTLDELRNDHTLPAINKDGYFLMANAYATEGRIDLNGQGGTEDNPIQCGTICLQRSAARIDFAFSHDQLLEEQKSITTEDWHTGTRDVKMLQYQIEASDLTDAATVYVTHIIPYNAMQKESYLMKTFAQEGNYTPSKWCVREDGYLQVLDPYTSDKQNNNLSLSTWYSDSQRTNLKNNYATGNTKSYIDKYAIGNFITYSCEETELHTDFTAIVEYVEENCQAPTSGKFNEELITGLLLRTEIVPTKVHKADGSEAEDWKYTVGNNLYFWRSVDSEGKVKTMYFESEQAANIYQSSQSEGNVYCLEAGTTGAVAWYDYPLYHYKYQNQTYDNAKPMTYVTVRNNIYRSSVVFTGPGKPKPFDYPDPTGLNVRIYCNKWNLRVHDTIYL